MIDTVNEQLQFPVYFHIALFLIVDAYAVPAISTKETHMHTYAVICCTCSVQTKPRLLQHSIAARFQS